VTPNEIAATIAKLLGLPVRAEEVPRETWESLFKSQGMRDPTPRIKMLDGSMKGGSSSRTATRALSRETWCWKLC